MPNLKKQFELEGHALSLYKKLRALLYLGAVLAVVFLALTILFPTKQYGFSFLTPNSEKNSLNRPYLENNQNVENKKLEKGKSLFFFAVPLGNYSKVKVKLNLEKNSKPLAPSKISVKKTYRAFLYSEGSPIGFADGTLLKNQENYFLVSLGKLRKFSSLDVLRKLGYQEDQFEKVSLEELGYNPIGAEITNSDFPVSDMIFEIDGDFYLTKDSQTLQKFSSQTAYLTRYGKSQALKRKKKFLAKYQISPDLVSFADGSLVSSGISAYIISDGKILPINNPQTFLAKGYSWDDIVPIGEDEISLYEKTKLFTISDPHPDGTVFKSLKNSQLYIIRNGQKHLLPSEKIAHSWTKKSPVDVYDYEAESCQLQKERLFTNRYSCEISLEKFQNANEPEFHFSFYPTSNVSASDLKVSFEKNYDMENLKASLKDILDKIKLRYVPSTS